MTLSAALRSVLLVGVAAVLAVGCSGGSDPDPSTTTAPDRSTTPETTAVEGPPAGATETGWSELQVGSCFDPIDDAVVDDLAVWLLPCSTPHRYEVFEVIEDAGDSEGGGYPGTASMQNWAEEACFSRFEAFVGIRWTISELDIATWWPTEDSWNQGDRTVLCTVTDHSGRPLEGTQRGSQR